MSRYNRQQQQQQHGQRVPHPVHEFHNMPRHSTGEFHNVPVERNELFQEDEFYFYDVTRNGVPQTIDQFLRGPRVVPHSGCEFHNVAIGIQPRDRAPLVECSSSPDPTKLSGGNSNQGIRNPLYNQQVIFTSYLSYRVMLNAQTEVVCPFNLPSYCSW